jgi:hypothetical protein
MLRSKKCFSDVEFRRESEYLLRVILEGSKDLEIYKATLLRLHLLPADEVHMTAKEFNAEWAKQQAYHDLRKEMYRGKLRQLMDLDTNYYFPEPEKLLQMWRERVTKADAAEAAAEAAKNIKYPTKEAAAEAAAFKAKCREIAEAWSANYKTLL